MQVDAQTIPLLPRGVRLRHDPARGGEVLLAPERVVKLDETAHAVLAQIDGQRDLATIAGQLAQEYAMDAETILKDIVQLVAGLHARGLLELKAPA